MPDMINKDNQSEINSEIISRELAVTALKRMFHAFSGMDLSDDRARMLLTDAGQAIPGTSGK